MSMKFGCERQPISFRQITNGSLAEKIEYYQDDQILQSELAEVEFETRLEVIETCL